MNMTRIKQSLSSILCMVLIAATALCTTGCDSKQKSPSAETSSVFDYSPAGEPYMLGEGEQTFSFSVTHLDGEEVFFELSTDEATVGAALMENGLIAGEDSQYGLMVSTVNGQTLLYEDGAYWAFYIDGSYAMTGVDSTEIVEGQSYAFRAGKA